MIVVSPLAGGLLMGGLEIGQGIFGSLVGANAQRQEYLNQRAVQAANNRFARWQSEFSKRITDENQRYAFWQQTLQHNQELSYINSLRNVEIAKSIEQAKRVEEARSWAGADYINTQRALTDQLAEVQTQDAVAHQQYQLQALRARASVMASDQTGATIDRLIQDYDRQQGDWEAIQTINEGLRTRQFSRAQAGAISQYLNAYNSQAFYAEQPYLEPMAPFQPLPTLLAPPSPSFTGSPPSGAATALAIGGSIFGGLKSGYQTYSDLRSFTSSGRAGARAAGGSS